MVLPSPYYGPTIPTFQSQLKRSVWNYNAADFNKANSLIDAADWLFLQNTNNIDNAWSMWKQTFMSIMKECIPQSTTSSNKRNLSWKNKCIRKCIRKRNRIYKEVRYHGCSTLYNKYKIPRNKVVSLMRDSKKRYLRKMTCLGSKYFAN